MVQKEAGRLGASSVFTQLQRRTHSGLTIAIAAIFDRQLEMCLKKAMRPMSKKLYAELFGPMRALSSFSSKITMAYALSIITRDTYSALETLRKIRNAFAHTDELLHFESVTIAPLFDRLRASVQPKQKTAEQQFLECLKPIDDALGAYLAKRDE